MTRAAAVLAVWLAAAPAAALTCPREPLVVTVELRALEPRIDRTMTRAELTALSGAPRDDTHTLGMYAATWTIQSQTQLQYLREEGPRRPRGCVWLSSMRVTVGIDPRVIRVARELRPGSCRYRAVVEHERKHQAVDDEVLARRMPWLRTHLEQALVGLRSESPRPDAALDAFGRTLMQQATRGVTAAWQEIVAERDRLQAEVDTPAEYARVRGQCPE
jgi:hypothetical protein